jgi:flagella basal body P-ring formation protein FlgA
MTGHSHPSPQGRGAIVAALLFIQLTPATAGMQTLFVPTAMIAKGEIVSESGLREKAYFISDTQRQSWVSSIDQAIGKEARRTLVAGKPIPITALKLPDAVKRGKPARAIYRTEGLEITTVLTPLEDAPEGASIRARNADTGIIVEAMVQANGELLVEAH